MEEIKVGEYVRTKQGYIAKVTKQLTYSVYCFDSKVEYSLGIPEYRLQDTIFDKVIVKHSLNVIDLIEEGDYVNGYKVIDVLENLETGELHLEMTMDYTNPELGDCTIYNKDIKDVVTKEKYNQMKYIVQ